MKKIPFLKKTLGLTPQPAQDKMVLVGQVPHIYERTIAVKSREINYSAGYTGTDRYDPYQNEGINIQEGYVPGINTRVGRGSMDRITLQALPRTNKDRICRALEWRRKDDLLGSVIDTKIDFAAIGFQLKCKPKNYEIDFEKLYTVNPGEPSKLSSKQTEVIKNLSEVQSKINDISQKLDIYSLLRELLEDLFTTDSCILYWKTRPEQQISSVDSVPDPNYTRSPEPEEEAIPGLVDLCTISPDKVNWNNSFGMDILSVQINKQLRDRIQSALSKVNIVERNAALAALKSEGIEQKWIDAVAQGQEYCDLRKEDGDNWIVKTRAKKYTGLADPSMYRIFLWLENRKMLTDGDFSAAFMMKNFIMHIKMGESITNGPMSGLRNNWATVTETDEILKVFNNTSSAQRVATNHTVSIEFVFPPGEMFDPIKYKKPELQILTWGGISITLMTGEGDSTYGGGYMSIKRLVANLYDGRRQINWVLATFFNNPEIKAAINIPDDVEIVAIFDENALKEPRQLLDECKFLVTNGLSDPRTTISELGRDPDAIKMAKMQSIAENNESKVWEPVFNPNNKLQNNAEGNADSTGGAGRPANENTTQNEQTRNQDPATGR